MVIAMLTPEKQNFLFLFWIKIQNRMVNYLFSTGPATMKPENINEKGVCQ